MGQCGRNLQPGDIVYRLGSLTDGEVLEILDGGARARVRWDTGRERVVLVKDLRLLNGRIKRKND